MTNEELGNETVEVSKIVTREEFLFNAKMGSIKDRNGRDLIEAEILRRGGKKTQKNCIKNTFKTHIIMMELSLT